MSAGRFSLSPLWLLAPLLFIAAFLVLDSGGPSTTPPRSPVTGAGAERHADRLVVVVLDSLRRKTVEAPGIMPHLLALSRDPGAVTLDTHTCASNFSLPCLQTIFEGRESPMAAGLKEFVGGAEAGHNLFAAAEDAGLGAALVSNPMLQGLYGRHTRAHVAPAVQEDQLASDLEAVGRARAFLADPANHLVVLHTVGTDHITHYDLPGSPGYARHFRAVDAAVRELVGDLDLSRDSLVILGDHGHDEDGHHVRQSIAIFAGRRFVELFSRIRLPQGPVEERDLLYFFAYALRLPLPVHFEGTFFGRRDAARGDADDPVGRFESLQRQVYRQAGWTEATIEQRMRPEWRPDTRQQWDSLWRAVPMLACLLLWIVWCVGQPLDNAPMAAGVAGSLALVLWLASRYGVPAPGLAVVPLLAIAALVWKRGAWRVGLLLLGLLFAGALTARFESAWAAFFHSRDEFHPGVALFFVIVLGAGAVSAWLRSGRVKDWPYATQLACLLALPPGVYYYQFNENLLRSALLPAALLAAVAWVVARRRARSSMTPRSTATLVSVTLLVMGALLLPQEAGGWQWHAWLVRPLEAVPTVLSIGLMILLGAWLVWLVPGRAPRLLLASAVAGLAGLSYVVGDLRIQSQVAAMVAVLFGAAWFSRGRGEPDDAMSDGEADGLLFLAVAIVVVLTMVDGFVINNVDFTFALRWVRGTPGDGTTFLMVAVPVALKYAWPILALLLFYRLRRGGGAASRMLGWALLFLVAKVLALLVQILVGALDPGEKFYELAMTDLLFLACLGIVLAIWTVLVAAGARLAAVVGGSRS